MKIIPLDSLRVGSEVRASLNRYSVREEQAKLIDYRSPLYAVKNTSKNITLSKSRIPAISGYKPISREEIVDRFYSIVMPVLKDFPEYQEGEEKYYQYRGSSRSVKLPYSKIKEGTVYPYFINQKPLNPEVMNVIDKAIENGLLTVHKYIKPKSLRLISLEAAMEELPTTTMGGLPFMLTGVETKDGKVVKDNRQLYLNEARRLSNLISNQQLTDNDILSNSFLSIGRGQEVSGKEKIYEGMVEPKQRRPGAEAHAWTIIGSRMTPFLEARKRMPGRAALVNQRAVDDVIANMGQRTASRDRALSGDGSSYDTWMMEPIAAKIADAILSLFAAPATDMAVMKEYFKHMFHTPLVTPEGIILGTHGMPSGTKFTNDFDSCYNEVLVEIINLLQNEITLEMVTDQGDDAVMIVRGFKGSDEKLAERISYYYGLVNMEVNPSKQRISRETCEYLKRLHVRGTMESYRSYIGTLIGACNLESAKAGRGPMHSARGLMQTANHYKSLPGFNEFMKYIEEGDSQLHLGVGNPNGPLAILQLAGGTSKVLDRLGFASYATQLGVDTSSKSIKLANQLSSFDWVLNQTKSHK